MGAASDIAVALVRGAVFVLAMQAAGTLLFRPLALTRAPWLDDDLKRIVTYAAALAILASVVRSALEPIRMAGSLSGVTDPSLIELFWDSNVGSAQRVRVIGLLLCIAATRLRTRRRMPLAWIAVGLVASSFSFMGHTRSHDPSGVLGVALTVHLLAAAFWFGSLVPLDIALRGTSRAAVVDLVAAFSRWAVVMVPALLVAGVVLAWQLLDSPSRLLTPYGYLLTAKVAGFSALVVLAAMNRYRLTPALAIGGADAPRRLSRIVRIEGAIMVLVLFATATMTSLFSPS